MLTFVIGVICIWILKLIIEAGYDHKIYITYIVTRLTSNTVIMSLVIGISTSHMIDPPDTDFLKGEILKYYLQITLSGAVVALVYLLLSSIVYYFHMSVVKQFYKIVSIIVEAHVRFKSK